MGFFIRATLLLRRRERPDFIALDPLRLHAAHRGVVVAGAEAPGVNKQLAHGVDAHVRGRRDGTPRSAFAEHRGDFATRGDVELVYTRHNMNFLAYRQAFLLAYHQKMLASSTMLAYC